MAQCYLSSIQVSNALFWDELTHVRPAVLSNRPHDFFVAPDDLWRPGLERETNNWVSEGWVPLTGQRQDNGFR
jgi:hypothetical protein